MGALTYLLLIIVSFLGPFRSQYLLHYRFADVVDGIEKYKSEKGRCPEKLDALVPSYVSSIPSCWPGFGEPNYYSTSEDINCRLTCMVFVFWRTSYDTKVKGWYGWD